MRVLYGGPLVVTRALTLAGSSYGCDELNATSTTVPVNYYLRCYYIYIAYPIDTRDEKLGGGGDAPLIHALFITISRTCSSL